MKTFLFILSFYFAFSLTAQFDFGPSNYFYFEGDRINVMDSLMETEEVFNSATLPGLPGTYGKRVISKQRQYRLLTGNSVELTEIGDSLLIYQEGKNFTSNHWDRDIYFHGEMKISNIKIDVGYESYIPLSDEFGEPVTYLDSSGFEQYVFPVAYALVAHGLWYEKVDSVSYEMGEYEMGKRIGIWNTFSINFNTGRHIVILEVKKYENGRLISDIKLDKKESFLHPAELERAIQGKWYNTGWSHAQGYRVVGQRMYIFSRDSTKQYWSGRVILDFVNLKDDGTFDKISRHWCGTGGNYDENDRKKEWLVDKERDLILDGGRYHLEFLSDEIMVLTFSVEE